MPLSARQIAQYHRDGYLIVPGMYPAAQMDAALAVVEQITYGCPYEQWRREFAARGGQVPDGISAKSPHGRSQFPSDNPALDGLMDNPAFLDAFSDLLGTQNLNYCNGHLFVRAGPTDNRHAANPWEGYHFDHDTNSFLPPWIAPGSFDYINAGVYLHDVELDGAPMRVCPGSHRLACTDLLKLAKEGVLTGPNGFTDIRKIPGLAAPVPATAAKGSVLFYSSYLIHAAVPFENKARQRAFWTMSIGRADHAMWTRFSVPYHYADRPAFVKFWAATSARVRTIFGWPPPGHPYYTPQTLDLLAHSFPGIDLAEYRR